MKIYNSYRRIAETTSIQTQFLSGRIDGVNRIKIEIGFGDLFPVFFIIFLFFIFFFIFSFFSFFFFLLATSNRHQMLLLLLNVKMIEVCGYTWYHPFTRKIAVCCQSAERQIIMWRACLKSEWKWLWINSGALKGLSFIFAGRQYAARNLSSSPGFTEFLFNRIFNV